MQMIRNLERICDTENVPSVSSINRIVRNKSTMNRITERSLHSTSFFAPSTPYTINELLGFEQSSKHMNESSHITLQAGVRSMKSEFCTRITSSADKSWEETESWTNPIRTTSELSCSGQSPVINHVYIPNPTRRIEVLAATQTAAAAIRENDSIAPISNISHSILIPQTRSTETISCSTNIALTNHNTSQALCPSTSNINK
ncbi:unnamed protein product [Dracunculus medinensis]|uniref:Uncharacterized protein n=1 Tax=Dracunculus medinensis TaxID=318479 RepID=A0A158Q639_DRAME|nr:unnamed protein product [Dracunculus medinensis]